MRLLKSEFEIRARISSWPNTANAEGNVMMTTTRRGPPAVALTASLARLEMKPGQNFDFWRARVCVDEAVLC